MYIDRDNFYKTNLEEQEVNINMDFLKRELDIYTSRKSVYERIKRKIGAPTKTYYIENKISGAIWTIPFKDRKKMNAVLSSPTLIGQLK